MKSFRTWVIAAIGVWLILPAPLFSGGRPPGDRTTSEKNCADLLARLGRSITENERFDRLGVNPHRIPEGGVFFSSGGEVVIRPYGARENSEVLIVQESESTRAVSELVRFAETMNREVILMGDLPFNRILSRVRGMNLQDGERRIFLSINPTSPIAQARRRLLEQTYRNVEIVVDIQVPTERVQDALHSVTDGPVTLGKSDGRVRYISMRDLPGKGTLAERLLAARPPPGTLRITVTHHSNGVAHLSDGSRLPLSELGVRRIADGDMDVYVGCNLTYEEHGWLVINGDVVGREIADLGEGIVRLLRNGPRTGSDILGETMLFDRGGGNRNPGGGDGPPGGGDRPPMGGDGNDKPGDKGKRPRVSFRFLEVIAFSFAAGYGTAARAAGVPDGDKDEKDDKKKQQKNDKKKDDGKANKKGVSSKDARRPLSTAFVSDALSDEDQSQKSTVGTESRPTASETRSTGEKSDGTEVGGNKKNQGGIITLYMDRAPSILRIGGKERWFGSGKDAIKIHSLIFPWVVDRPILFLDASQKRIIFFEPSRQTRFDVPAPALIIGLAEKPTQQQLAKLKEFAPRFWFYAGAEQHPVKTRQTLLQWQQHAHVTLPFIFLVEKSEPSSATWTLLKPFLQKVSHTGESLPRNQGEAAKCGLFWCSAHKTDAQLQEYRKLTDRLEGKGRPARIDLRGEDGKMLANLLREPDVNAWLVGVWVDNGLRRPDGLLPNFKWVDNESCQARIAFVSPYPVSASPKGRYYETVASSLLPKRLLQLHELAKADRIFPEVRETLDAFSQELRRIGGLMAVSSCGKYLIVSE